MRTFPRAARRRLTTAVAVGAVAVGALSVPSSYASDRDDDLKKDQKQVQRQIDSAADEVTESSGALNQAVKRLESAQADLAAAEDALSVARSKLSAAQARDQQMQAELATAEAELAQAETDLATGETAMATQQDVVADTISDIYRQGDPELLAFAAFMDAETPADLSRGQEARRVIVGNETRAYDELHAAAVLLDVRRGQVEVATEQVAQKRQEAADHLVEMQALEADAAAAEASVTALVQSRASARVEAREAKWKDIRTLRALKKREAKIEAELKARALAALRRARANNTLDSGPSGGYLSAPANGPVTSPFGYRVHPIYGYWGLHNGTDFGAACGSPLYAAADGTVVSRSFDSVYGNRLVIDNGAARGVGLATIYNHATSYSVSPGQKVQRGQVIGSVGSTGWSTGCHLHFIVMANGTPVDPQNWL